MVKLSKIGFFATLIGGLAGIVFGILNLLAIPLFTSWYDPNVIISLVKLPARYILPWLSVV